MGKIIKNKNTIKYHFTRIYIIVLKPNATI